MQIEGLHAWVDCPFEEVAYLRDMHRHVFWIRAWKKVNHDDRDVEFIMLKHEIQNYLFGTYYNHAIKMFRFGPMSCEQIGRELMERFGLSRIEVSEDNENGAVLTACAGQI